MDYILFTFEPNKSKIEGMFDEDDGNIYIEKRLSKLNRELVLAHERQHRTCFYSNCSCYKSGNLFLIEYHAFLAELLFVLKQNSKKYWNYYFRGCRKDLIRFNNPDIDGWITHWKALRKVCKLKVFQQYAKEYGYSDKINYILNISEIK